MIQQHIKVEEDKMKPKKFNRTISEILWYMQGIYENESHKNENTPERDQFYREVSIRVDTLKEEYAKLFREVGEIKHETTEKLCRHGTQGWCIICNGIEGKA